MRKLLMAASAAAMAITVPVLAQGKGEGRGNAEKAQKADKDHGDRGHGRGKAERPEKAERGAARQEAKAEKQFRKQEMKADKQWAKAQEKAERQRSKAREKVDRQFARQEERAREENRRFRDEDRRFASERDDRDFRDGDRRFAGAGEFCPPGLAKKNNGCMPPGQAKKAYGIGERLPSGFSSASSLPAEYRDWYPQGGDYSYRYDDSGYIYRVNNDNNLISGLIPLLGGGFGVGNLLPSGYDVYNLPVQYRDDYYDTAQAQYRYGDDAIYKVDPQSQMIQAVVALLAGDLNVGQVLPSGYDTYNLPMQYRDQYVDSDEANYRYADGNIYQIDPQTQIIEQIVAMLT